MPTGFAFPLKTRFYSKVIQKVVVWLQLLKSDFSSTNFTFKKTVTTVILKAVICHRLKVRTYLYLRNQLCFIINGANELYSLEIESAFKMKYFYCGFADLIYLLSLL